MAFKRSINPKLLTELQIETLYKNKLYIFDLTTHVSKASSRI